MKLKICLALIGALVLAVPTGASAHVTLQPSEAAAGDFAVLALRVPNERDDAATTKVAVKLPPGFVFVSYQPVAGWSAQVQTEKLAQPIVRYGEEITEQVGQITWTADSDEDGVQPGQFQDFPLSVQIPGKPGDTLTFEALQAYDDGEVASWTGAPDSDEPAPQVIVTEGDGAHHDEAPEPASAAGSDDSDDAGETLAIAALVLGALGLLAGGAALVRSARTA